MDARFEVEELTGQVLHPRLPWLPEVMGQETHQHGPHPEIQVPRLRHAPHAGIHKGESRPAFCPSGDLLGIDRLVEEIVAAVHIVEFHPVLHFELLDEVTMPAQPAVEGREVPGLPGGAIPSPAPGRLLTLVHLPDAEVAPGEVRTQPAAPLPAALRLGDGARIAPNPVGHKGLEVRVGLALPARLEPFGRLVRDRQKAPCLGPPKPRGLDGLEACPVGVVLRRGHVGKPGFTPARTVPLAPVHPIPLVLMPGNARRREQIRQSEIPVIGVSQSRFAVAVHTHQSKPFHQVAEHLHRIRVNGGRPDAGMDGTGYRPLAQLGIHVRQALLDEGHVAPGRGGVRQIGRLETIQQQMGAAHPHCFGEGRVVPEAQVALQPDDTEGRSARHGMQVIPTRRGNPHGIPTADPPWHSSIGPPALRCGRRRARQWR